MEAIPNVRIIFHAPDTDIDDSIVEHSGNRFTGIGEDDGLPNGTPFQVKLVLECVVE